MKPLTIHNMKSWLAALACLALASCVNDKESDCTPVTPGESDIWLSVSIHNLATVSRADAPDDGEQHPDEDPLDAENYINTSDVNLLLFDNDKRLIRTFDSNSYRLTGADGAYTLSVKASSEYFAYAGSADDARIDCSIMVIANLNGTGQGDGPFEFNNSEMTFRPLAALSELYRGFPYTGSVGDGAAWEPAVNSRLIPMSGIAKASFTRAELNAATTEATALKLPAIYIQRAMAKVRLIDAIQGGDYEITAVTLTGSNTRGTYLPLLSDGAPWAENTAVIEYGTARPEWYDAVTPLPSARVSYTDNLNLVGKGAGNQYEAYRVYVPELDRDKIGTAQGPTFNITVRNTKTGATIPFVYTFLPGTANPSGDFARNHIYQVAVTGVQEDVEVTLQTRYSVCPWSVRSTDIEFN